MVLVNSPNNPTGWTMPRADWDRAARALPPPRHLAGRDDAYERIVFDPALTINGHAPSVLAQVDADDRVHQCEYVLEELDDDRLAPRLAGRAARASLRRSAR